MKVNFKDVLKYKVCEFIVGAVVMILTLTIVGLILDLVIKYQHFVLTLCLILSGIFIFYWLSSLFGYIIMELLNHDLWFKANYGKGDEYFTFDELKERHSKSKYNVNGTINTKKDK